MTFSANVGSTDRILRIIIGLLLIAAPYFTGFALWGNPAARWFIPLVGVVLVLTAFLRFCPIYTLVGASTKKN